MSRNRRRRKPYRHESVPLPMGTVHTHPCAVCGKRLVLRRSRHGVFYSCEAWPACDGAAGAHASGQPLGIPATREVKLLRIKVHELFDPIWQSPTAKLNRKAAYQWFAQAMGLSSEQCHIGAFDKETCERAIELLKQHHQAEGSTNADL